MPGWIKLHRKFIEWEWYSDLPTKTLFIHLLLIANHTPKKWQGKTVEKGELITSINLLSEQTGLTIKQVRTALDKLESTGEIEKKRASKGQYIKVRNYEVYQGFEKPEGQANSKQRASKGQAKGNKQECKELKNDNNYNITSERTHAHTHACEDESLLTAEAKREPATAYCPDVLLTEEQDAKLLKILSLEEYDNYIENLQKYIDKGHKVHNCYQTILKWAERDRQT